LPSPSDSVGQPTHKAPQIRMKIRRSHTTHENTTAPLYSARLSVIASSTGLLRTRTFWVTGA
jgi:hypothetical protein